jgi:hypothetical protein
MTRKAPNPSSTRAVCDIAGAREDLALQDAEPDFDLVQPRGVHRQELEPHTASLLFQPSSYFRRCMDRQVVGDEDQLSTGPATPDGLQQLNKLAGSTTTTDECDDLSTANVQACKDGQDPVSQIVFLDPLRPAWSDRSTWMQVLENLDLRFLVHTDHAAAAGRMQIQSADSPDLDSKLGIGTVQPTPDPIRFEIGLLQPSRYRALANGPPNVLPTGRRLSKWANRPVRPGCRQLGRRVARETEDFVSLLWGKTPAGDQSEARPAVRRFAFARSARPNVSPTFDPGPRFGRWPRCSRPRPRAVRPELEWQPRFPSGLAGASDAGSDALRGSNAPRPLLAFSSCTPGYLTDVLPWGRTFGTRH